MATKKHNSTTATEASAELDATTGHFIASGDIDRIENAIAKATGIINILGECYDPERALRPQSLTNALWTVQDQIDEIKAIVFGEAQA